MKNLKNTDIYITILKKRNNMMPQFHETGYGARFYNHQLPSLIRAIEKLAKAIEDRFYPPTGQDNKQPEQESKE